MVVITSSRVNCTRTASASYTAEGRNLCLHSPGILFDYSSVVRVMKSIFLISLLGVAHAAIHFAIEDVSTLKW